MKSTASVKYKDLTKYSQTIGAVMIDGFELQLCDYVEAVNGKWYALAYFNGQSSYTEGELDNGIIVKCLNTGVVNNNALFVGYIPQSLLPLATPMYNDENNTQMLIERLESELKKLNTAQAIA